MESLFTGERFEPNLQGEIRLEHYHRYVVATEFTRDKAVLDLACGEGYGSLMLSETAKSVVGVDISPEAVSRAQKKYATKQGHLVFMEGSASSLMLSDKEFDVVVSFETIEHLYEQNEMLSEIRRVLKPNGILIISSPNKPVYSKNGSYENHFHVKELDFSEFDSLLKKQFKAVKYFGQRLQIGSVIQPLKASKDIFRVWGDDGRSIKGQAAALPAPVYYIAICTSSAKYLPELGPSALYPTKLDLLEQYQGYASWAKATDIEIEKARQIIGAKEREHEKTAIWAKKLDVELKTSQDSYQALLEEHEKTAIGAKKLDVELKTSQDSYQALLEEHENIVYLSNVQGIELEQSAQTIWDKEKELERSREHIQALELETVRRGEWALGLIKDLNLKQEELNQVLESNSWLITMPLREIGRWANSPTKQMKRYLTVFLSMLKRGYQCLPFNYVTRSRHKASIRKVFPWMLRLSNTSNNFIYPRNEKAEVTLSSRELGVDFSLPTSLDPIVSVIIPIYGKVEFTLACLRSITKYPPKTPFEVVVVDDCSPDSSAEILTHIEGLQLYSNTENQGFIKSCNVGARLSKGQYVYFLNNDTEVTDGWLDNLLQTFYDLPGTGLVGSKLIYPDGSLQEAGGIIWRDGSAWNFGRNQDASLPVFNYAREVDYCSGASIMIPHNIFDDMGGFDELYIPAYCEDADLALKIRRDGYRVIYQPTSVVIHFEGISSGTDTAQGVKAYQIENSKKLFERWKDFLRPHQPNGIDVDDAKDRASTKRVLVLDHCTPTPNQDAGSVTTVNTLILLRELGFQVTFIAEDNYLYMPNETLALQRIGVEVLYAPYVQSVEEHVKDYGDRYDLVFLFRPVVVERHIKKIRTYCSNAKVLFHTIDLHFLRLSREAVLQSNGSIQCAADEMSVRELLAIKSVDAAIVHSTAELEILRPLVPEAKLYVFPLILDVKGTHKGFEERKDILFVGGYQHAPNVDAVHFFVKEIMPILRKKIPGVRFFVAGSKPPPDILNLSTDDITIMGFVQDLDLLLDKVRVSVAPLRYGAGIKGKVGTAMAAGLPVVGTTLAAEGMLLSDGENIILADTPEDFAVRVSELYSHKNLWEKISCNGKNFAEHAWGGVAAINILSKIVDDLNIPLNHKSYPLSLYSSSKS